MIQTFQGYFQEDGRFVSISDRLFIQIPVRRRTIITILNDEIIEDAMTDSQKQKKALNRLYIGLNAIDDEPLDDEFDAMISHGFNIMRELDV